MITIKNLHNEKSSNPWDVRVDRNSVLGNPFYMKNGLERNIVCDKYQIYFDNIVNGNCNDLKQEQRFMTELSMILLKYSEHGKLNLFCWCAPKRCHAETIKNWLVQNTGSKDWKESSRIEISNIK